MIEHRKIKDIALKAFDAISRKELIGNQNADQCIEKLIFDELRLTTENIKIVSEEYGTLVIGNPEQTVIVDPIDGTCNLIRGIPIFSVAIALCDGNLDRVAVKDIRYSVIVSTFGTFESSFGDLTQMTNCCFSRANEALLRCNRPYRNRLLGASTIELCLLSQGSFDGFIETKGLKCVDLIPTLLILKKNSCVFSDKYGNKSVFELKNPKLGQYSFIAARTQELHDDIIKMINMECEL